MARAGTCVRFNTSRYQHGRACLWCTRAYRRVCMCMNVPGFLRESRRRPVCARVCASRREYSLFLPPTAACQAFLSLFRVWRTFLLFREPELCCIRKMGPCLRHLVAHRVGCFWSLAPRNNATWAPPARGQGSLGHSPISVSRGTCISKPRSLLPDSRPGVCASVHTAIRNVGGSPGLSPSSGESDAQELESRDGGSGPRHGCRLLKARQRGGGRRQPCCQMLKEVGSGASTAQQGGLALGCHGRAKKNSSARFPRARAQVCVGVGER